MPGAGWEVEHITCLGHLLAVANRKEYSALFDQSHLFVGMIVCRRDYVWSKSQATNHHFFAHQHLSLNALFKLLDRHIGPIRVQSAITVFR